MIRQFLCPNIDHTDSPGPHSEMPHLSLPEQLQGLTRLAETNNLEMRTVLLRVMTDLHLSRAHHTAEETRQFEEIFLGLLPHLEESARATIATKFATSPQAPDRVLAGLIERGGAPAAEILKYSTVLSRKTLLRAAMQGDVDMALAIAGRSDLDEMMVTGLASRREPEVLRRLALNPAAPISRDVFRLMAPYARTDEKFGRALCQRNPDMRDLAPLFLWASHLQRAAVLLEAKTSILASIDARDPNLIERATAQEIERAATAGDWPLFGAILARCLGCSLGQARAILADRLGEPLVIALGSLFLTAEQVTRILMCPGAPVAHSFERIQSLIQLLRQLPRPVCVKLMREMVGRPARDVEKPQRGQHQPIADQTAAPLASRPARVEHRDPARARLPGLVLHGRRA
jgi:uncharacterized protein (DUF2336 family)